MSRSRPASNPISYHKYTKQYYITRSGRRIYLGSDKNQALTKYHQLGLGVEPVQRELAPPVNITAKNLANRFLGVCRRTSFVAVKKLGGRMIDGCLHLSDITA